MKPVIVKGDRTSHGGRVLEGNPSVTTGGRQIAQLGHSTFCPLCKGKFPIAEGVSSHTYGGKPTAVNGMKTACGATLIASQSDMLIDVGGGAQAAEIPAEEGFVPKSAEDEQRLAAIDKEVDEVMADVLKHGERCASNAQDPRDYRFWPVKDCGGTLSTNPNGPDYPAENLPEGTRFTKQIYTRKDGFSYPVIRTEDGRVLSYPGNELANDVTTVVIAGLRPTGEQQFELDVVDQLEKKEAQIDADLRSLAEDLQKSQPEIQISPAQAAAAVQEYLETVSSGPYAAETLGMQSLPGTIDGVKDAVTSAVGVYEARNIRESYIPPQPHGTGAVITANRNPADGAARVTVSYGVTQPGIWTRLGIATGGLLRKIPLLSVIGTTLEYGAYHLAGLRKNAYGDSRYTFAADATLDAVKAIFSGLVGVAAGAGSSAMVGALAGSAVAPGLGTLVGAVVGLGIGIWASAQFENQIYAPYRVRQSLSEFFEGLFK